MASGLSFLLEMSVILAAAIFGGFISKKLGQPAVLGQIIAGIALGLLSIEKSEFISHISEIGVIFLMFIAGLETDVKELVDSGKSSSMIALGGVLVPGALVFLGMYAFTGGDIGIALFMAVVSTATSVSISVQTLREMNQLRTRQGISILGAAIIDDIVGIILLTFVVAAVRPTEGVSIAHTLLNISLFFIIAVLVGYALTKFSKFCQGRFNLDHKIVSYSIIVCFVLAFLSEELGVAAITGSYFAGVMFSMTPHRHKVSHEVNKIASIFFTPVFFVAIGMGVNLKEAVSAIGIGSIFIVLAVIGKLAGCGLGAKMSGFSFKHAMQIGVGMIPRAEVAIIIATLGVKLGVIGDREMAAVILMVVATTLATPSLLKLTFNDNPPKNSKKTVSQA